MSERSAENDAGEIRAKVEASSLGTPEAQAIRATVSDEDAARVVARARELSTDYAALARAWDEGWRARRQAVVSGQVHANPYEKYILPPVLSDLPEPSGNHCPACGWSSGEHDPRSVRCHIPPATTEEAP